MKGAGAWVENEWEEIRIGSKTAPKITLVTPCARCLVCFIFPSVSTLFHFIPYSSRMFARIGASVIKRCPTR